MSQIAQRLLVLILCLFVYASPSPGQSSPQPQTNRIVATIAHIRGNRGQIICTLFASADGFPSGNQRAFRRVNAPIRAEQTSCEFSDVPPGTYAVAVLQDENLNDRLDTGMFGAPAEPVGVSNNVRGSFGPPHFDDARFVYHGGLFALQINLY